MVDILNIIGEPIFDDRIIKFEIHTYNPYANATFGHSDEIRIPIQQQDLYMLPCESFLYIEGRLTVKKDEETPTTLGNNCIAFMFDEIRYELNNVEIDRNRNVGITSTLKNYVSLTYDKSLIALNAGWDSRFDITEGYFNFYVPLNMLLGFCEDYKRVIVNARHELILIRARNDNNCILGNPATEPEVELIKVQWRMPHDMLNEINKLSMLRALESGQASRSAQLSREMTCCKIKIVGLNEMRWKNSGDITTSDNHYMIYSGNSTTHINGDGIVITTKIKKSLMEWNPVSDRLGLISKLQVFVNKCLRRILRLFWANSPTNEELLRASKQEKIGTEIRRRKWKWIGHTLRKDSHNIAHMAMEYNPQGKRKRGRPAMSWRRTIDNEIKPIGKSWAEIKTTAQNRVRWRRLADVLCST
ncbi:hypothetical protein ALC62_08617 [Cyphomyrmex costatus]|uniref:Double jelly roll-like domain-containing protein n=1 Tax=Cyphomyrmex costatus TaxID=456900 RepID=A0A151IGR3_9HYME|nr:hypothetical protein ALC62_08617 [Cyphomyrmex costatus]